LVGYAEWRNDVQVAENKAAIQLAEAKAETAMQLTAIRYRNDAQAAETKAAREAQLQHIRQIESQRAAKTPMTNPGVQTTSDLLPEDNYDVTMEGPSVICNTALSLHQLSFEMSPVDRGVADSPVSLNLSDSRSGYRVLVHRSQTTNNDPQKYRRETTQLPVCVSVDDDYNKAKAERDKRGPQDPTTSQDDAEKRELRNRIEILGRFSQEKNERYDTATETMMAPPRTFVEAVSMAPERHIDREIKKERTAAGSSKDHKVTSKNRRSRSDEQRPVNGETRTRRSSHDRPSPNNDDDGDGDDDDPRRGKVDPKKDIEREARKPTKGHPGGDGGGGGGGPGPPSDADNDADGDLLPTRGRPRARRMEPGDSDTSCADKIDRNKNWAC
jgi:hypothetical protein